MDDLIAFWAARLDEDEAAAKRGAEVFVVGWPDYQTFDSPELDDAGKYLDRFSPARMLRQVEADRAFLALVPWDLETRELMDTAMRIRLTVWSGHPDYRPEWKP